MKNKQPITKIILDIRRKRKDDLYPVKIRITYQRTQKLYPTGLYMSEEKFKEIFTSTKLGNKDKMSKMLLIQYEQKAIDIIAKLPAFSFSFFEKNYLRLEGNNANIYYWFELAIKKMEEDERIGNANSYLSSMNSLKKFHKKETLYFTDITPEFLLKYQKYMLEDGNSLTTVGIYLRPVRALFNQAIKENLITKDYYPFGRGLYSIPAGRNTKKALRAGELSKIYNYSSIPGTTEYRALKIWIFSYLCNGMNINDIAKLKYHNIKGGKISFYRAKTIITSVQDLKRIEVIVTPPVQEIIDDLGIKPVKPEKYIFGILSDDLTPRQAKAKIQQATKQVNKYMKRIAKAVGIETNLTSYVARHSFATRLRHMGGSIEFIAESLGHTATMTTKAYLDSFEDELKGDYAKKLYEF
jgi:site-specific recombinase XerD